MTGTNGNGNGNGNGSAKVGTSTVKQGLAQMLKGGVIVSIIRRTREDLRIPLIGSMLSNGLARRELEPKLIMNCVRWC